VIYIEKPSTQTSLHDTEDWALRADFKSLPVSVQNVVSNTGAYREYLNRVKPSINVNVLRQNPGLSDLPFTPDSWPKSRNSSSAKTRVLNWCGSIDNYFYFPKHEMILSGASLSRLLNMCEDTEDVLLNLVPIFTSIANKCALHTTATLCNEITPPTIKQENKEMFNSRQIQTTSNAVIDANKEAVQVAAKLSVGKAANSLLLSKVTSKFPWYAKLFGKAKQVEQNPFAKLASAEVVIALSRHFAPDNQKLKYLSEAMLQEAMVDIVTNSTQLESIINELTSLVPTDALFSKGVNASN
jgi:hypothetical protein